MPLTRTLTLILVLCLTQAAVARARPYSPRIATVRCNFQQQAPTPAQLPSRDKEAEKIKTRLTAKGIGAQVTLYLKNGDELHGTISQLSDASLQLSEIDQKMNVAVRYSEIKKFRSGTGGVNPLTGKRTTLPKSTNRLGMILTVAIAVIIIPAIVVAASKE